MNEKILPNIEIRSFKAKERIFRFELNLIERESRKQRSDESMNVANSLVVNNPDELVEFDSKHFFGVKFLDKDRGQVSIDFETRFSDDNEYRNLVHQILKKQKLDLKIVKEVLNNQELQDEFIALVDSVGVEGYNEMAKAFQLKLFKYFDPKNAKDIAEIFLDVRRGRRLAKITKILVDSDEFGEDFFQERKELEFKFLEGGMSREEYLDAMDEMYERYVKLSGDEELVALWESVNVDEKIEKTFINTIIQTAAVLVATTIISPKEQSLAKSEVESQFNGNYSVEFGRDGLAMVKIADFSVDLIVRKDLKTGKFIYFVNDEYINGGKNFGPFDVNGLPSVIDARRIDAYVTKKVGKMSDSENFSSMRKASDRKIESIGLKLLGEGRGRGFDFGSDDFIVLDNLASSLLQKNDKYINVGDKIDELNRYLNTQARFDTVRTALLNNKDIWQMM